LAASAVSAPRQWKAGGKSYPVSRLSALAVSELMNLIRDTIPDPRAEARKHMEGLPPETAKMVWESMTTEVVPVVDAQGNVAGEQRVPIAWPPSPTSPAAMMAIISREGQSILIYHALRRHMGGFTRDDAARLVDEIDDDEFGQLIMMTLGPDSLPKGDETPSETTTTTRGKTKATGR
jgi:hypothetical protein